MVLISVLSDLEKRRLRASKAELDRRWTSVSTALASSIGQNTREVAVEADYQTNGVWTGLRGASVERIERNRGRAAVAPLLHLPDNLIAWLGYQEIWDLELGQRPFTFRQSCLTVHVGEMGDPLKPQMLRLEWPGIRDWNRTGVNFQSPGAGHPHWQVDAFESFFDDTNRTVFEIDAAEETEDFEKAVMKPRLVDRVRALTFERMHLASAAPWWSSSRPQFGEHHLNAPADLGELSRWLAASIVYIKQELSRCSLRR